MAYITPATFGVVSSYLLSFFHHNRLKPSSAVEVVLSKSGHRQHQHTSHSSKVFTGYMQQIAELRKPFGLTVAPKRHSYHFRRAQERTG